jgi:hypothetical protein
VPRIKRWFPVSHDFLDDPDVIEMRQKFGDRSVFFWLRLLSWADRNEGEIKGSLQSIALSFGRDYDQFHRRSAGDRAEMTLRWMVDRGWIELRSGSIYIVNYAKYHRTEERKPIPPNLPILSEPSESYKISPRAAPEPSADVTKVNGLDAGIKRVADRIYATDTKRFLKLIIWIKEAQKHHFADKVIAASLLRFEPYAAQVGDGWYPYLDKIINKVSKDFNMSRSVNEHEQRKADEREVAKAWNLKGLVKDA